MTVSRYLRLFLAILGCCSTSCSDYAHSNPFDPARAVTLAVTGTDTLFSSRDTARFVLATDPNYAHEAAKWTAPYRGDLILAPTKTPGEFTLQHDANGTQPKQTEIMASLGGGRSASKTLVVWQRPVGFIAAFCSTGANSVTVSIGAILAVCSHYVDRGGAEVNSLTNAQAIVRNPAIVTQSSAADGEIEFQTRAKGTTWVLLYTDTMRDSVRFTVQ